MENKKIKLKKVDFLGYANFHLFIDANGNEVVEECSNKEYKALEKAGAAAPTKDGCVWKCSFGEGIKVDTPKKILKKNEYCDLGTELFVCHEGEDGILRGKKMKKEDITSDEVLESKLKIIE